jgi:ferritin-like metal-binding protein YciE
MKTQGLNKLFIDELADMYNSEMQITDFLPKLIKLAALSELKNSLTKHLLETKNQAKRIKKIFSILGIPLTQKTCKAMQGLIHEAEDIVRNKTKSPTLDAAIISAAQKIEHYEMASYGTLRSFANHLSLKSEIADLLQENLNEEGAADKKLTKIADGTFFSTGVNSQAAKSSNANAQKNKTTATSARTSKTAAAKAKSPVARTTKARKSPTTAKAKAPSRTSAKKTSSTTKRAVKSPALTSRTRSKATTTAARARHTAVAAHPNRSSASSKLKSLLSHGNKASSKMKSAYASARK